MNVQKAELCRRMKRDGVGRGWSLSDFDREWHRSARRTMRLDIVLLALLGFVAMCFLLAYQSQWLAEQDRDAWVAGQNEAMGLY